MLTGRSAKKKKSKSNSSENKRYPPFSPHKPSQHQCAFKQIVSLTFQFLIKIQEQKRREQEKAERHKRRVQDLAEQKARVEAEKEKEFLREQEVRIICSRHSCSSLVFMLQRLKRLEEERAERHRKRVAEIAEQKARDEEEKEHLFQKEQEVYYLPPLPNKSLVRLQPLSTYMALSSYRDSGSSMKRKLKEIDEDCKKLPNKRPEMKKKRSANSCKNKR